MNPKQEVRLDVPRAPNRELGVSSVQGRGSPEEPDAKKTGGPVSVSPAG